MPLGRGWRQPRVTDPEPLCYAITRSRERGHQHIFVMQTAQHRSGAHAEALADPMAGWLRRRPDEHQWRIRYAWTERHVGASVVVMTHPCRQDRSQVRLRQRYQPVQALSASTDCRGLSDIATRPAKSANSRTTIRASTITPRPCHSSAKAPYDGVSSSLIQFLRSTGVAPSCILVSAASSPRPERRR